MTPTVHILSTVRKTELLDAALLVFKSFRVGFPTARGAVYGNGHDNPVIRKAAESCGLIFQPMPEIGHGDWVEQLLFARHEPYWILDSDVIFFESMEQWDFRDAVFAGRLEPEFREEWSDTIHVERLHPSLMYFDPVACRREMRLWPDKPKYFSTVDRSLIKWHFVPRRKGRKQEILFYDVTAGLHHAITGTRLTKKQNEAFEHLCCGTYSDLIGPHVADGTMFQRHRDICAHPELARGLQVAQNKYYASRAKA